MNVEIVRDEKNELEVRIDNQTVAELVRTYLNQDSAVELGAWRNEHYSRPLLLKIVTKGKTAKKALQDAITKAQKDLAKYKGELAKAK